MAFLLHSVKDGHVPPWEYLPVSAITPKVGMALVLSSGQLAVATGTTKPTHISMVEKGATCTAGEVIPVIAVTEDLVFKTTNSAAFTSINKGDKVTLHASSGLQVTATTASGVAEVVDFDATASGSDVLVKF